METLFAFNRITIASSSSLYLSFYVSSLSRSTVCVAQYSNNFRLKSAYKRFENCQPMYDTLATKQLTIRFIWNWHCLQLGKISIGITEIQSSALQSDCFFLLCVVYFPLMTIRIPLILILLVRCHCVRISAKKPKSKLKMKPMWFAWEDIMRDKKWKLHGDGK